MVKVISFDLGGTLVVPRKGQGYCSFVCNQLGVEMGRFRSELAESFLIGESDPTLALESFCKRIGRRPVPVDFRPDNTGIEIYRDVVPTLSTLRERGYRLVALSNCTPWESDDLGLTVLGPLLDEVFRSHEIRAAKPSPYAYQAVEASMRVNPDEVLHVGDDPVADYCGARKRGWSAILIDRSGAPDQTENARFRKISGLGELLLQLG